MDMPDMYQVKFRVTGHKKWTYGILSKYASDAKEEWEKGNILVEDAILPVCHVVPYNQCELVSIPYTPAEWNDETKRFEQKDEYHKYVEEQFKKTREKSNKAETLKDKMFNVPVADGRAYYVVTKVNKKTVHVEWRGFCPDRWRDSVLGIGGKFPKERIESLVKRNEGLAKLFSRK